MKKLVTGANGFIGSNLVEYLVDKGESVLGIDKDYERRKVLKKYITGPTYYLGINKLTKNFDMIWDNVKFLERYSEIEDIDTIYHLAAASDIKRSFKEPTWDLIENVLRTHDVLEMMRKKDIKNIIFTSTSVVHGADAPHQPQKKGLTFILFLNMQLQRLLAKFLFTPTQMFME